MESLNMVVIVLISFLKLEIYRQSRFQKPTNWIFGGLIDSYIFLEQISKSITIM